MDATRERGRVRAGAMALAAALALALGMLVGAPQAQAAELATAEPAYQAEPAQVQAQAVAAASGKTDTATVRALYRQVLGWAKAHTHQFAPLAAQAGHEYWMIHYSIFDLGANGVPELFVGAGTFSANFKWYGYTVKAGKLVYLGSFGTIADLEGTSSGALYSQYAHMGSCTLYKWKLSGGRIKLAKTWTDTQESQHYPKLKKLRKKFGVKSRAFYSENDYSGINALTVVSKPGKGKVASVKSASATAATVKAKASGAKGFQYKIALNKKFTKGAKTKTTAKKSYKFSKLAKNKTYYVKVRAYKSANGVKVWGKWSAVKKVKLKAAAKAKKKVAVGHLWAPKSEAWFCLQCEGTNAKVYFSGNRLVTKGPLSTDNGKSKYKVNSFKLNSKSFLGYYNDDARLTNVRLSKAKFKSEANRSDVQEINFIVKNGYLVEARVM